MCATNTSFKLACAEVGAPLCRSASVCVRVCILNHISSLIPLGRPDDWSTRNSEHPFSVSPAEHAQSKSIHTKTNKHSAAYQSLRVGQAQYQCKHVNVQCCAGNSTSINQSINQSISQSMASSFNSIKSWVSRNKLMTNEIGVPRHIHMHTYMHQDASSIAAGLRGEICWVCVKGLS